MRLEPKHSTWILALAAWTVFVWVTFARNLLAAHAAGEDRSTGYWVVHSVLIVVNLLIAAALVRFGLQVRRATRDRVGVDA